MWLLNNRTGTETPKSVRDKLIAIAPKTDDRDKY